MNRVRAGVVQHPSEWPSSGYGEIQAPPQRDAIIDRRRLAELCGLNDLGQLPAAHAGWVADGLAANRSERLSSWSSSLAVGSERFVAHIQRELGARASHRSMSEADGLCTLAESPGAYDVHFGCENGILSIDNTHSWGASTMESNG
jgi:putative transposase